MTDGVRKREVQPIVRHAAEFERAAHVEPEAAAHEDKRNIVERVAVALAEFVGPKDQRVIQEFAVAPGLRRSRQPIHQINAPRPRATG